MKEYKIGDIVGLDEYTDSALWCRKNNAYLKDIYDVNGARKFEIKEIEEPEPHIPTWEEIDKARELYREEHIDLRTKARVRKMANGTWTEKDEQAYLELDAEVTAWIEENLPYPEEKE